MPTTAITSTAITIATLAGHAAEIRRLGKRVLADYVEIGRRLAECRTILKEDGGWRAWLDSELRLSPQTAGRFIQIYEQRSNLEHCNLPVSVLYLLAAPSTPAEARTEIVERAQAGEPVSVEEVKQTIETAKGREQPARKPPASPVPRKPLRDDIGSNSASEVARLQARIDELQADKRRLEIKIIGQETPLVEGQEWKPQCLAHLPVATRLEMLVGLLEDGLAPAKKLVAALRLQANASVTTQSKLKGVQALVGRIFDLMNIIGNEVAGIKEQLVAYEQRETPPPAADSTEINDLRAAKHQLESENAELARKIEEYGKDFQALRDKFVALSTPASSPPADDGLDIQPSLRRTAP